MNARVEEAQEKVKAMGAHDMSATEAKIQSAEDRRQQLIQSTQEKCAAEVAKVRGEPGAEMKILMRVFAARCSLWWHSDLNICAISLAQCTLLDQNATTM